MEWILDLVTQVETMVGAGVAFFLITLYQVRKFFKSGKGVAVIVAYAGNQLIKMFTSDDPETQAQAEQVLDGVLKLPKIKAIFKQVDDGIVERTLILEKELADVEHKLSLNITEDEIRAKYLAIKARLEQRINELNS